MLAAMQNLGTIPEGSNPRDVFSFTMPSEPQAIYARFLRPLAGTSTQLSVVYNRDNDRLTQFELPWLGRSAIADNGDGTWTVSLCGAIAQQGGVSLWWGAIGEGGGGGGGTGPAISIATMAGLAATPILLDGALAIVRGFYANNDGGGGIFYADAGSSATPVTGMVIAAAGGRWVRQTSSSEINVKWFGAIGDGASHPLTGMFASVTAARIKYPCVQKHITGTVRFNVTGTPTFDVGLVVQDGAGTQWEVTSAVTASGATVDVPVRAIIPGVGLLPADPSPGGSPSHPIGSLTGYPVGAGVGYVIGAGLTASESDAACLARHELDWCAFQSAVNACVSHAGGVFFPRGIYTINQSILNGPGYNSSVGDIYIRGENAQGRLEGEAGSCLRWSGLRGDQPLLWLSGYNYVLKNFTVSVSPGCSLLCGVEYGNLNGVDSTQTTNHADGVTMRGSHDGVPTNRVLQYGFIVGYHNPRFRNQENHSFDRCVVTSAAGAGLWICSGQPYNISWNNGYFQQSAMSSPERPRGYGVLMTAGIQGTGTLRVTNTDVTGIEVAIEVQGCSPGSISWVGGEMEKCKKAYHSDFFGLEGTPGAVAFRDVRVNNTYANKATDHFPDTNFLMFQARNGVDLILDGVYCDDKSAPYGIYNGSNGPSVRCDNCTFSTNYPLLIDVGSSPTTGGVYTRACKSLRSVDVSGAQTIPFPNLDGCHCPPGQVTIGSAGTPVAVPAFTNTQGTDYTVEVFLVGVTGTPAAGSTTAYATNKTSTGFDITPAVAPGGSATVTFGYRTYR